MNNPTVSHVRKNTMRTKISILLVLVSISSLVGCSPTSDPCAPDPNADPCIDFSIAVERRAQELHCTGVIGYCPEDTYGMPLTRGCTAAFPFDTSCDELRATLTACGGLGAGR